jgi:hypothetical protein
MAYPPPPPQPYSDDFIGTINVARTSYGALTQEILFFTSGGVIVAKTGSGLWNLMGPIGTSVQFDAAEWKRQKLSGFSAAAILAENEKNFAIADNEIVRVVLKQRRLGGVQLVIATSQRELTWAVMGSFFGESVRDNF